MLIPNRTGGAMMSHDDHPTHEQLRQFVEKYGPEILEVIREQNLTGVDNATRFQRALTELSYRWGVLPDPGEPLSELLAEGFGDDDDDDDLA
jgi:hypothetical protein